MPDPDQIAELRPRADAGDRNPAGRLGELPARRGDLEGAVPARPHTHHHRGPGDMSNGPGPAGSTSWQRVQAFYELSEWQVTVRSGEQITICADSVSEEEGNLAFNIAIAGSPISQLPVATIPVNLVRKYESTYVGLADPPVS
jgi:hypothetical protein